MTAVRYTPGPWRAVVSPQGVAVLPETVDAELLGRIWASLEEGKGLGAVLESLTGAFGTSLSALPPFAVATVAENGGLRLAVRGEPAIELVEADGTVVVVSGADVTTWNERAVSVARRATVRTPGSAEASGEWYGITDGVVLCSALELVVDEVSATAAPAAPAELSTPAAATPVAPVAPVAAPPTAAPAPVSASDHAAAGIPDATLIPEALDAAQPLDAAEVDAPVMDAPAGLTELVEDADPVEGAQDAAPVVEVEEPAAADETPDPDRVEDYAPVQDIAPVDDAETPLGDVEHTQTELPDDAYDHLWGATVVKSVEDAAVRDLDEDETEDEPGSGPAEGAGAGAGPAFTPPTAADPGLPAAAPAASTPAAAPAPALPVQTGGLIDSVPGFGSLGASSGSENLTGTTVPPASASVPAPATATANANATGAETDADTDHDGLTISVSELDALRRLESAAPVADPGVAGSLGRVLLSTGERYELDRPIIIGRRPRVNRVQADQVPVLVTVASPEQDISRNHLEVRLEGRHVLVVDLATTNGSVLHRDGSPPLRLGPNEPVLVLSGDVVDLGEGINVTFEEIR